MTNHTNNRLKHSRATRCLVTYLYWFCRGTGKVNNHGFLTLEGISRITGVPGSSVQKIATGAF
jgi:hypothetical protein